MHTRLWPRPSRRPSAGKPSLGRASCSAATALRPNTTSGAFLPIPRPCIRTKERIRCRTSSSEKRSQGSARLSNRRRKPAQIKTSCNMNEIITERSGLLLRVTLNRPEKKNAITAAMYTALANLLNDAASDDGIRVVLLQGAGDSFSAGNDIGDFLKHPPGEGGAESPQEKLIAALINFDKPLIAAVHGAAVGSGTTILTHCDFVLASENSKFQMPFINLAL